DAVANAEGIDFRVAGLGIDAADLRDAGRGDADVEGRTERNVEPAVLVSRDNVERAILEGETGGHVQPLEDRLDLLLAAIVLDRIDVAEAEGADEQRALVAPGHLPRRQHVRGIDLDLEA